ncbi:rhamnulokinase [Glycomyces buryatensis]|uniref:Rhamnulokinase n=1 Tax=Glycomyces buryatensis TaxID=2570927 RepID=A0A4S8PT51_9ACTN|nr:rhamnulokinase family protein [Glycomyces buryatensis]THV33491.1 rhamnulokinase [Glycomyces buryatensis]
MNNVLVAVDLGASSGRVMAATVADDRIALREVARFPNRAVELAGRLHWDLLGLWSSILEGLGELGEVRAIGVDSWAVDYGLIDADGHLLSTPVAYRDARNAQAKEAVLARTGAGDLFATTGIQPQPFNTLFQLAAERPATLAAADRALLIPDLIAYWLTGNRACEATNASTTGMVDQATGTWSAELCALAGIEPDLLGDITPTGTVLGHLTDAAAARTRLDSDTRVIATASHDTAAAVAAVPYETDHAAYISCGTWSLVGCERTEPILTPEALDAGFTNERGADGTIRFLRNIAGLWLLNESRSTWQRQCLDIDLADLIKAAAETERLRSVVDPDDPAFAEPGDMPARIRAYCERTGQRVPDSYIDITSCILDSLALAHRRAIASLEALTGQEVDVVHIVGGGSNNELLCQLTADATGRVVLAGPDEATALGNALVQAQATGLIAPGTEARRTAARASARPRRYLPQGSTGPWEQAAARLP